jgi:hypothetical protein
VVTEQAAIAAAAGGGSASSSKNSSSQRGEHSSSSSTTGGQRGFVPPGSSLLHHGSSTVGDQSGSSNGSSGSSAAPAAVGSSSSSVQPALVRPDVLQHFSSHPDAEAALDQVLQYGQRLLLLRANDWSALAAEGGTGEGGRREIFPVGWMRVCLEAFIAVVFNYCKVLSFIVVQGTTSSL